MPTSGPNSFYVIIYIESFVGTNQIEIVEYVPLVSELYSDAEVKQFGDKLRLSWDKSLIDNKTSVSYTYAIPMVFPMLYELGPVEIYYDSEGFTETR